MSAVGLFPFLTDDFLEPGFLELIGERCRSILTSAAGLFSSGLPNATGAKADCYCD